MPRGSSANSRKALAKNRTKTQFRGESAVKAAEKSNAVQAQNRKLLDSVRKAVAEHPELLDQGAVTLLKMAAHGNVKVWELLIRWFGEDPANKLEVSGAGGNALVLRWGGYREKKDE